MATHPANVARGYVMVDVAKYINMSVQLVENDVKQPVKETAQEKEVVKEEEKPKKQQSIVEKLNDAFEAYSLMGTNDPKTGLPAFSVNEMIKALPLNSQLRSIAKERREELKRKLLSTIAEAVKYAILKSGSTAIKFHLTDYVVDVPEIYLPAMEDIMADFDKDKDHFYITRSSDEFVYNVSIV